MQTLFDPPSRFGIPFDGPARMSPRGCAPWIGLASWLVLSPVHADTAPPPSTHPTVAPTAAADAPSASPSSSQSSRRFDINIPESSDERLNRGLDWSYCGPRPIRLGPLEPIAEPDPFTPIDVDAGGLTYHQDTRVAELFNGVHATRSGQEIEADTLRWDLNTGDVTTNGATYLSYPGLRVIGQDAHVNTQSNQGSIDWASYRFSGKANLRGRAEHVEILSPDLMHLDRVGYSSCPPGNRFWSLHARQLDLDQVSGRGKARDAYLRIKGIPVLYTPYMSFPIDDRRKSGFLVPIIGSSDETGFDITQPYYLNLAPNMDATLFPRFMSKRGAMLGGEFRYLTPRDSGTITGEIIPNDSAYQEGSRTRGALRIKEAGRFFNRWGTSIDYSMVSDDRYLEDLGNNLEVTSIRYLEQRADLTYYGDSWTLLSRVQAFQETEQDIDPASRPYGRLPQILFTMQQFDFGPGLSGWMDAEYDYFDHHHLVSGQRVSLSPRVSWPLRRSYGHLIPSLGAQLSRYQLDNPDAGLPADPSHIIPTFDLDGRLVFERSASWFGQGALQTLEPRLFYLYTPYEDQSDTPVFDSSELTFSYANLFRTNRFTGRDRVGDANQLTLGLSSSTLRRDTGEELFRLSFGHIVYFADRRVQIAGEEDTASSSPFAGEISGRILEHWQGRASLEWDANADPGDTNWRRRSVQLEYREPNSNRLLNLAYRFDSSTSVDTSYEDTDVSFQLPVGKQTELVGRWLYSVKHARTMEAIAGVEFGQCCWRLRLVGRHFKNSPESSGSNSVMLQLELAGLGNIGNSIQSFLTQEIYGYQVN